MRVKTGTVRHRKHQATLNKAKGMKMSIRRRFKTARQAELHAGEYAFAGRRLRKRDFRSLWIQRINAALRPFDISNGKFMNGLKKAQVKLNRKSLADLAYNHPNVFAQLVNKFTQH